MQYFNVFGKRVGSHILAMATLGTTFGVSALALSGGEKNTAPPIQASSGEEENFIKEFLAKATAAEEEQKVKH